MANQDYYRPSQAQINTIYRCATCGSEMEVCSIYSADKCSCGGSLRECGESYPSSSDDWDEQRDPDGEWRERRY